MSFLDAFARLFRHPSATPRDGTWLTGPVECRICGHEFVSVRPTVAGSQDLQCSRCGNMACDAPECEDLFG